MLTNYETAIAAMRAFSRFYTNRLGLFGQGYLGSGYNLTEARIVYEIGARGSATANMLTKELGLDPAYLSRILKRFREDGLLAATPDPNDQRSQILTPTARGYAEYERLGRLSNDELAKMIDGLGAEAVEALKRSFSTIRGLLDTEYAGNEPAVLRPHRPGDLGWMVMSQAEFYTSAFGWDQRFEALVADVAGRFLTSFDPSKEFCWIAERGGLRVGSVLVANGGDGIAKLRLLYVDPQARGLGLGVLLVGQCINFARGAGYRQLTLWTNDLLHTARHIYQRAGFRLVSEERHNMFGPEENGQTWTLDL